MNNRVEAVYIIMLIAAAIGVACSGGNKSEADTKAKEGETEMAEMKIVSDAFSEGDTIPVKYTCDGADVSPALSWPEPPEGTKSLALICDDPDAPGRTWVHWVVINIPSDKNELVEGVNFSADSSFAGAIQCRTNFGHNKYGGPCPPPGPAHRYFFKIYALDTGLDLTAEATKADVEKAMEGHILAQGQLMGKYAR